MTEFSAMKIQGVIDSNSTDSAVTINGSNSTGVVIFFFSLSPPDKKIFLSGGDNGYHQ